MKSARIFSALLLAAAVAGIVYLTCQGPAQTRSLSHPVFEWFRAHGWRWSEHDLRSLAHLPEYFILGCALVFFGRTRGWSYGRIFLTGAALGLLDECVKIALPTRHFDLRDLAIDVVAVGLAVVVTSRLKHKKVFMNDN